MIHLPAIALLAVLSNPGQPVLLDFYADGCGPCRTMEPTVRRLIADGYSVRKVNVGREQQLAAQFGISHVPTFVVVSGDREIKRFVGPTSYDELVRYLRGPPQTTPANSTASADTEMAATAPAPTEHIAPSRPPTSARQQAMQATVRLRIEGPQSNSFGTGTVIHARGDEALVMTCGHLFRDTQDKGKILADLFAPGVQNPVPGVLVAYDLENDTALVAIKANVPLTPIQIAPASHRVRAGDRVFSIGCDHGKAPSLRASQVTAVNKYDIPDNIVVAGAPVIGRSGGGLFTDDGQLIGVCNLANQEDDEGLYAALTLLHHSLDQNKLSWIYRANGAQVAVAPTPNGLPAMQHQHTLPSPPGTPPPRMPQQMPNVPLAGPLAASNPGGANSLLPNLSGDEEIIVIIRSRNNPQAESRTIYLNSPSRELVNLLAQESRRGANGQPPEMVAALPSGELPRPSRLNGRRDDAMRAQSAD